MKIGQTQCPPSYGINYFFYSIMAIVDGWRQRERETERECAYGGRDMLLVKAVNVVKILNCIIMQGKNCIMLKTST